MNLTMSDYFRFFVSFIFVFMTTTVCGKVFDRCELAQHLRYQYNIALENVAVWVCIAYYQSGYNTSAYGYQATGVGYYGMYQISDQYWCSPGVAGKICGLSCYYLQDDNLSDDLACMGKIYDEHRRLSGNGFNAWTVYPSYCSGDRSLVFIQGCFDNSNLSQNIHQRSINSNSYDNRINSIDNTNGLRVGKVYERCELANELHYRHNIPMDHVATWVCIAQHESNFNTSAIGKLNGDGSWDHGLFQISDIYWCSPPGKGWACGLSCSQLEDNDITDDVECMKKIHAEHQIISGDGFNAWTVYPLYCRGRSESYITGCFQNNPQSNINSQVVPRPAITAPPPLVARLSNEIVNRGKVYDRCELAHELRYKHNIPYNQIATWVCIAQHESNFNTSAIGKLNGDDSWDHGLFQISDIYWCSPPGKGWACGLSCLQLEDNDITDDVECMKKIHSEHQRLSGDGFNAWSVYPLHCKSRSDSYTADCFPNDSNNNIDYQVLPRPAITAPPPPPPSQSETFRHFYNTVNRGKVYDRCELANELLHKHSVPFDQIATWVCIAQHESNFNTSAIGKLNGDGSWDHGLFQISDIYWCSPPGKGWACGLSCSQLEDNDITDDVECMKKIYAEHQLISGDGFNAWTVYPHFCKGRSASYVHDCFNSNNNINNIISNSGFNNVQKYNTEMKPHKTKPKGKMYNRCELADELFNRHNIPYDQLATWVCIAQHESNFNTSAIGQLNGDGSEDHGIFQISDIYWCSPPGKGWACGLSCSELEDNDISDDVQCIKRIYEEHKILSGDGFNAWTVYNRNCKYNVQKYLDGCNLPNSNIVYDKPAITVPPSTPNYISYSNYGKQNTFSTTPIIYNNYNTRGQDNSNSLFNEKKVRQKDSFGSQNTPNPFSSNFFLNRAYQNMKTTMKPTPTTTKYSTVNKEYSNSIGSIGTKNQNTYQHKQIETTTKSFNYNQLNPHWNSTNINIKSTATTNISYKYTTPSAIEKNTDSSNILKQDTINHSPFKYYQHVSPKGGITTKPQSTTHSSLRKTTKINTTNNHKTSSSTSSIVSSYKDKTYSTYIQSTKPYTSTPKIDYYKTTKAHEPQTFTEKSTSSSVLTRPFTAKTTSLPSGNTLKSTIKKEKSDLSKVTSVYKNQNLNSNSRFSTITKSPNFAVTTKTTTTISPLFKFSQNYKTTPKIINNNTKSKDKISNTKLPNRTTLLSSSSKYISTQTNSPIATLTTTPKPIITQPTVSSTKTEAALKFDLWFDKFKHSE